MPAQPYVTKLSDGRYLVVELPEGSTEYDAVSGDLVLHPPAISLLDRLRTLVMPLPEKATAGRLRILRESLALGVDELANQIGVAENDVRDWEAGKAKPNGETRARLEGLRRQAVQNGVLLPERRTAS